MAVLVAFVFALLVGASGLSPCRAQIALPADIPIVSPQYGAPPAPTAITVRLLAVALPTLATLDDSSRLAATRASPRIKSLARRAVAATDATRDGLAASTPQAPSGPDPLDTAAAAAASVDSTAETILAGLPRALQTAGARSVAADRAIAAAGASDLATLGGLGGRDFDRLYLTIQREGLRRLLGLFRDYVQNGDDPALRALTVHDLPRIKTRLAALSGSARVPAHPAARERSRF